MSQFELVHGSNDYDTQMLYFTTSSISDDERYLYFFSNMTGSKNIYVKDMQTGEIKQLSDNKYGLLKSSADHMGDVDRGLGPCASDTQRNFIYYAQDQDFIRVDQDGNRKVLFKLPEREYISLPHVSHDGKKLCIATAEAAILEGFENLQPLDIDRRIQEKGYCSYLNVYDLETGEQILREKVEKAWVTHIQFSPVDSNLILYNHEWTSVDCGIRRIWLFNGKKHLRLRTEGDGRSRNDWTCHEFWSADGKYIYYHGKHLDVYAYVGRYELATGEMREISLDHRYSHMYGHFTVNQDGVFVSDGYYGDLLVAEKDRPAGSPIYDSAYLSIQKPNWEKKTMEVIPLGKHNSSWKSQDEHPHPIFNAKRDMVYFTSDMDGKRKIYKCKWKEA